MQQRKYFMQNTLLYEAICSLNAAERRDFSKFLHSPFFNTRAALAQSGDYLIACTAAQTPPDEAKIIVFATQSATTEAGQAVRLHTSALLQLLETFITYRQITADPSRLKTELAAAYRKRGLQRHFKITHREARQQAAKSAFRNADWLETHYRTEWEQYQFEVASRRTDTLNIQACSDALDAAFMANKLRLACLAISHQAIYKTAYQIGHLEDILEAIAQTPALASQPALGLYYHCYRFLTFSEGETDFWAFRAMLAAAGQQFPEEELRLLYLLAINYGIKQINRSAEGWIAITFDLYKGALKYDLLLESGMISRFAFSNIVAIGLRAGENEWVATFIGHYKSKLERQWRDATASLSMARLEYARKNFAEALSHLQRADYKDTMNNLTAKVLQMKIFYETGAWDALESHLKNLKNFIRRHTAIGYHRTNYSNIVRYTELLMQSNPLDKKALAVLREQIAGEAVLTEKEWLLGVM